MGRVLIVEDNDLNSKLFRDLLMIKKHEVLISKDGKNLFETVINNQPDLILMDIDLNGFSGIELIQELKQNPETKDIPIIVITAYAMKKEEVTISASGCDLYVSKPVSIDNFFQVVEKFIRKH